LKWPLYRLIIFLLGGQIFRGPAILERLTGLRLAPETGCG
jgi:hypothetical protein